MKIGEGPAENEEVTSEEKEKDYGILDKKGSLMTARLEKAYKEFHDALSVAGQLSMGVMDFAESTNHKKEFIEAKGNLEHEIATAENEFEELTATYSKYKEELQALIKVGNEFHGLEE